MGSKGLVNIEMSDTITVAFINNVRLRIAAIKSQVLMLDGVELYFDDQTYESVVCIQNPRLSMKPYRRDWTYLSHLPVSRFEGILLEQVINFHSHIPKCIQYVLTEPMIAFKMVFLCSPRFPDLKRKMVIELEIPIGATVNETILGHEKGKCRASMAITKCNISNDPDYIIVSIHDYTYTYPKVSGAVIYPEVQFDGSPTTCGSGIHFFKTYQEAAKYLY